MSLQNFTEIPVVDISGLYSDSLEKRKAVAKELYRCASEVGFLYVRGHNISQSLIDNLITSAKGFFNQSTEEKMQNYIGYSDNHSGYVPEGEEEFYGGSKDHKEAYDLSYDLSDESKKRPMLGANQWPQYPGFKQQVGDYYQAAFALGNTLFRGFALALGLEENYFDSMVTTPPSQLRLIHYPYNPEAIDAEGIGAHTDYECFTLLLPTADGLQVLNGNNEWIEAPVIPGCFVVNIGDMLEVLSNGRFIATSHRVRKVQEERYSFPLFCSCDYDMEIHPVLPPLPGNPENKYAPIPCGDHLYAQTIHTFHYLKKRLKNGEITLPDTSRDLASFGHIRGVTKPAASGENA